MEDALRSISSALEVAKSYGKGEKPSEGVQNEIGKQSKAVQNEAGDEGKIQTPHEALRKVSLLGNLAATCADLTGTYTKNGMLVGSGDPDFLTLKQVGCSGFSPSDGWSYDIDGNTITVHGDHDTGSIGMTSGGHRTISFPNHFTYVQVIDDLESALKTNEIRAKKAPTSGKANQHDDANSEAVKKRKMKMREEYKHSLMRGGGKKHQEKKRTIVPSSSAKVPQALSHRHHPMVFAQQASEEKHIRKIQDHDEDPDNEDGASELSDEALIASALD